MSHNLLVLLLALLARVRRDELQSVRAAVGPAGRVSRAEPQSVRAVVGPADKGV